MNTFRNFSLKSLNIEFNFMLKSLDLTMYDLNHSPGISKHKSKQTNESKHIKSRRYFVKKKQTITIIISSKNRVIASGFGQNMTRNKEDLKLSRTIWNKLFLCLLQNINIFGVFSFL